MFEIEPDALIQDKYVLKRELGAGGFGLVWLAGHKNLTNRLVAIKFGMNLIGDAKDRFANEIKILDSLSDNPYIIKAEDVGNHGQIPYLVLEYAPEGDLDSYASKNPPTLTNIAGWLKQLANALDYAHSKGIVHRDLKPANILFMRDGSLRLCDFGIAHDDYNQFTVSGYSMGTLEYMSPEQIRSFRGVGPQTDTWALGVITLKLITGRALFDAKNASSSIIEVYEAVTNATVPTLTIDRTGAKVPLGMQKVIERVLEKDPAKRLKYYPTVTKFAEEFAAAIAPRPAKVFIANKPPLPSPQRFPAQAANPAYVQLPPLAPQPQLSPKAMSPAPAKRFAPLLIGLLLVGCLLILAALTFTLLSANNNKNVGVSNTLISVPTSTTAIGFSANLLTTLEGHTAGVYNIAWSPEGKTLASASKDKTVRLWEIKS